MRISRTIAVVALVSLAACGGSSKRGSEGNKLVVGDVVTPQPMDALGMFTTLNNLGMDFKTAPDEYMG